MREVILDFNNLEGYDSVYDYIKQEMEIPPYYEDNLDSLYDALLDITEETEVKLYNCDYLIQEHGEFGEKLIQLIEDSEEEASCLTVKKEMGPYVEEPFID